MPVQLDFLYCYPSSGFNTYHNTPNHNDKSHGADDFNYPNAKYQHHNLGYQILRSWLATV